MRAGRLGGYQPAKRRESVAARGQPVLPAAANRAGSTADRMEPGMSPAQKSAADELRDAAHAAFMAFWRGANTAEVEGLWLSYCVAQQAYEASLRATQYNPVSTATAFAEQLNIV